MKIINFINTKMHGGDVPVPQFLYKYRPFDKHAMDMLENEYVYLCPAKDLDDPSECAVDFSLQDVVDLQTNRLTFKGIEMLLAFVKPYTSDSAFQQARDIVYQSLTPDGVGKGPDLLEAYFQSQDIVPNEALVPLINQLRNIPEKINDPKIRHNFEKLFSLARDARQGMGICSLSELKNSEEMWNCYAAESTGYCVEYDMSNYKYMSLLYPVVYQDNRDKNIVTNILGSFIGEMIFGMSNGQLNADRSHFMRLFLTKDLKWGYQKEWRLLGDADQRLRAPTVHAVYLGKNISEQNKIRLTNYCNSHNILIRKQNSLLHI